MPFIMEFLQKIFLLLGFVGGSTFPKPLSEKDEKKYIELFENGDENARNILIEHNLRLVAHIAKKYATDKESLDDLISIGTIGLIKGINTFDSKKTSKLTTYIARCIENAVLSQEEQMLLALMLFWANLPFCVKSTRNYIYYIREKMLLFCMSALFGLYAVAVTVNVKSIICLWEVHLSLKQ